MFFEQMHPSWQGALAGQRGLLDEIEYDAFPGMGVYVMRSPRFYVAVRCGEIGLAGLGGHTHCDQLTIELVIDGITKIDASKRLYRIFLPSSQQ